MLASLSPSSSLPLPRRPSIFRLSCWPSWICSASAALVPGSTSSLPRLSARLAQRLVLRWRCVRRSLARWNSASMAAARAAAASASPSPAAAPSAAAAASLVALRLAALARCLR